jgi:photosystem II stability/assembly factor-like uncharacterized protein
VLGSGLQGPGKLTLAVSKDAGKTWIRRYFPPELYAFSCPSIATCYTVGGDTSGQVGTVLITRDGGMKWLRELPPITGKPLTLVAVACPRVNMCFAAVHEGSVLIRRGG